MTTISRLMVVYGLLLVMLPTAKAQVVETKSGYLFRIKFIKNKPIHYSTSVRESIGSGANPLSVLFPITQVVTGLANDTATIRVQSGPMTINKQAIGGTRVYTMKVSNRGRLVGGQIGANSGITVFPTQPVRPGQSWSADVPVPSYGSAGSGSSSVKAKYVFVKIRKLNGVTVAQLAVTMSSEGSSQVDGHGDSYVLVSDGNLWKSTLKLQVTLQSQGQSVPVVVSVNRS